jgi:dihydroorotate dehydrogenase electron transfer subunit
MLQFDSTITSNRPVAGELWQLNMTIKKTLKPPLPGQFMSVRVSQTYSPLLRRPFAFYKYNKKEGYCSILYQIRGTATRILSEKHNGDMINIIGPLGNGFNATDRTKKSLLIAGGIGLGPILYLAEGLNKQNRPYTFVFGCRNRELLPDLPELKKTNVVVCTEDGSVGFKGKVTDYLKSKGSLHDHEIFACGPLPMLKACHHIAREANIPCWIPMEQVMACSMGACMGCVIKVTGGYARVCTEGPVFNSNELVWT